MPADLLFEIGCEEIPARMLARALAAAAAVAEHAPGEAQMREPQEGAAAGAAKEGTVHAG